MPELSRFHGIVIRMYAEFGAAHRAPHFHAYHQDHTAVFGIEPVELLAGSLPQRQRVDIHDGGVNRSHARGTRG
jgi:hypothetical protein